MKKDLLKEYNKKRDFKITREPSGKKKAAAKKKGKLSFVVQEHHARRLHYDFRLEWEGVLKSWAVPKGPSLDPADKRLAVQTEDHPLEYGKFHGTIPEGEYGAGEVFIWDKGTWEPEGDPDEGFRKGHLVFSLKGKKLQGKWHLVRTHFRGADDKNWLLMKRHDEEKTSKPAAKKKVSKKKPQKLGNDPWPKFIPPHLPRLVTDPPSEGSWVHEMKHDGYRVQAHLRNGIAHLFTRKALDWSNYFPHILESVGKLPATNAIFDGEIVALDDKGRSHFQSLQNSFSSKKDQNLRYYIFDLLYLNGKDLRSMPLTERKELLADLLKDGPANIIYSEHFTSNGGDFFKVSCEHELEGMISKLAESPYRSGRNDLWMKIKCSLRQEFVIGGYTEAKGGRTGFGALLLGIYEGEQLRFAGRVGTGFDNETLREIKKMLSAIEQKTSPFKINSPRGRDLHWVKPIKVAEVTFGNWTNEGILRTPVFLGLREDKPAKEISVEKPKSTKKRKKVAKSGGMKEISSPEKILFTEDKVTKQEVDHYYQTMAKTMLPYMENRPLTLVRCPEGSKGSCFYQKHIASPIPEAFTTFPVKEDKGEGTYIAIDSHEGLRELVQINAYEIHAWNCHYETLMRPDQIVMDLDPGPGVTWKAVVDAAFELKEMLEDLNLKSFVKLTGGKGLHLHIPVAPLYDWDQIKSFSQSLALELVSREPKKYVANMSKKLRKGKIFVDYLRNGYGATAVVPYSLRAKAASYVAMPLDWKELRKIKGPGEFTLARALKKIKSRRVDPWKGMLKLKQKIEILKPVKGEPKVA